MKKFILGLIVSGVMLIVSDCFAGMQDGTLLRKGLRTDVSIVAVSSSAVSIALPFDSRRVDFAIRHENSSYDVMICSGTSMTTSGFPIKSGETYSPDGFYPGEVYLLMEAGSTTTNVYTISLYRQEY